MSPSSDIVDLLGVLSAMLMRAVDMGHDAVGYTAAKLLDSLMDEAMPTKQMITLPPKGLVAKQSTDALAVEDSLVAEAMRFIAERGHTGIDVDDVAEAVLTTRRTLERKFRSVLDRSIAEEMLRLKIERAKRQLADTETSIKTLALESGLSTASRWARHSPESSAYRPASIVASTVVAEAMITLFFRDSIQG
jgi:LacI family transcriptional regulator